VSKSILFMEPPKKLFYECKALKVISMVSASKSIQ
jgi:hypothetical protein